MTSGAGPTFLGIGAQKAGTTWLHRMLASHPAVGMPQQKELHFWDRDEPTPEAVARYRARFADLPGTARGEITPSYAILPLERIAEVRRHLPDLKLIYVLRNPIERAWSQARMELARTLHHGTAVPESGWDDWLSRQMASSESRQRGDYAACLRNWFAHYPRERFLIGIHEQNRVAPRGFLQACARHLGVDATLYASLPDTELARQVLPETDILKLPRLDLPATPPAAQARTLVELYGPLIAETERMLDLSLAALWLAPYS